MRTLPVLVAVVLDRALREPPLVAHPVRAMGRLLDVLGTRLPSSPPGVAVVAGGSAWTIGAGLVTSIGIVVDRCCRRLPEPAAAVSRGLALWPLLSLTMLLEEVAGVERALRAGNLEAARAAISGLVSRDVTRADEAEIRAAAISSLAENLVDGFVAPLLWFALGGLPAAAAYRYVNTADAMWGYRDERWRHAGRVAARADDVANLLPARLAGLGIATRVPIRRLAAEAARTPSPNGGWPMAALALRLGIRLEKPGVYVLNPGGGRPAPHDTTEALRRVRDQALGLVAVLLVVELTRSRRCRR